MSAEAVERELGRARVARRQGDGDARLAALDAAWDACTPLRPDHPLRVRVAWKRAKGHFDLRAPESAVACVAPVLEHPGLIDAYPPATWGLPRLARAHQDRVGFAEPAVDRLWERWTEHQREAGDRRSWALGRIQLAWAAGCRGDAAAAVRWVEPVHLLSAGDLGDRPPERGDAGPARLHLDAAHALLRPAVWGLDVERASTAREQVLDALHELGSPPPLIALEALQEAHVHLGTPEPAGYDAALAGSDGFRGAYGRALLRRDPADALDASTAEGPEWRLAVLALAGALDAEALALAERSGCAAFTRRAAR